MLKQPKKVAVNGHDRIDWSVVEQGCDCDWRLFSEDNSIINRR